jgi:hypothetical protein
MLKVQKMLFCFNNISAETFYHISANSFGTEYQILAHFLPDAVSIKSIENFLP